VMRGWYVPATGGRRGWRPFADFGSAPLGVGVLNTS
jgi:hypothetical protein